MNLLFICYQNIVRSRTAEIIYAAAGKYKTRSAGISKGSRVMISGKIMEWADIVFVMEAEQKDYLISKFPVQTRDRNIIDLDICNDYYFMQPELEEIIKKKVSSHLEKDETCE